MFAGFPREMIDLLDQASKSGSLRELLTPYLAEIPLRAKDREWVVSRALDHGMKREQRLSEMFTGDELSRDGYVRERGAAREAAQGADRTRPGFQV